MSTQALSKTDAADVSERVGEFGFPVVDSKVRSDGLKAIAAAGSDWRKVGAEVIPTFWRDPSAAERELRILSQTTKDLRALTDAMRADATRIVRAVRAADPKASLVDIGKVAEGTDVVTSALKQRWSRYGLAVDLVSLSEESVKDRKRERAISLRSALNAAENATESRTALREMARDGADMPTGGTVTGEQSAADGQTAQRVYTGADVLRAAHALSERVAHLDRTKIDAEQIRTLAGLLTKITSTLGAVQPVTPEPKAPSQSDAA